MLNLLTNYSTKYIITLNSRFAIFLIMYIFFILYLQTADMGITEHIEGDECKFSVWTGRAPAIENKAIMKVTNHIYFSTHT